MLKVMISIVFIISGMTINTHAAELELIADDKVELYPMSAAYLKTARSIAVALGRIDAGEVEIRDLKTWGVKERLRGYGSYVYSVAWSDSKHILITGSADGAIRFWDLRQHSDRRFEKAHEGALYSIAVNGNGLQAASGGADKMIRIWTVEDGRLRHTLVGHDNTVLCLAWSHDNRWLISGDQAGICIFWDASSFTRLKTFETDSGIPWQLTWDENTSSVWLGENGYGVKRLSVPDLDAVSQTRFSKPGIKSVVLWPSARTVGIGIGKSIHLYDAGIQTVKGSHELHDRGINCLIPLPDNQLLSLGLDRRIRLWKTTLGGDGERIQRDN